MVLKGKKSTARIKLTYSLIGFLLWLVIELALFFWYYKSPQFFTLIIWLMCFSTVVILYFFILRGFFLNNGSGYEIDKEILTIKDGYPNQKSVLIKIADIDTITTKKVKGLFKFGLGKTIITVYDKKYVLKNVDYEELKVLESHIKSVKATIKEDKNEI